MDSGMNDIPAGGFPRLIGITGGIGSGKSVVSRILALRGFTVYDCDTRARELMHLEPLASRLREVAGPALFGPDGRLDRTYLSERLFADAALRCAVNLLVHSAVREDIVSFICGTARGPVFVESAIMAVSGLAGMASLIWVVDAPLEERIRRVMKRGPSLSREHIMLRVSSQRDEIDRLPASRLRRVDNSGTLPLLPQIAALLLEAQRHADK